jgi:hypothetical protein
VDDEYRAAYRRRARERAARQFSLIFDPIAMVGAVYSVIAPIHQAPGDDRSDPVFRFAIGGVFFVFGLVALVTAARWLIADRRQ